MTPELQKLVNKRGHIEDQGIQFAVRSVDARRAYGRVEVCIEPIAGTGRRWVREETFIITGDAEKVGISSSRRFV